MSNEDAGESAAKSEAAEWDERYATADRIWSGQPNGVLLREVAGLTPGRALDVGCGEGADAVWLWSQGWAVTALDVSQVALERARSHAAEAGAVVTWLQGGLLDHLPATNLPASNLPATDLPAADLAATDQAGQDFDLVSAQYPALRRTAGHDAERALIAAVAPEGTLLVVHHDTRDREHGVEYGFDPDDWVGPHEVARLLDESWTVEVDEVRERTITGGAGAHHVRDLVLRARRTG